MNYLLWLNDSIIEAEDIPLCSLSEWFVSLIVLLVGIEEDDDDDDNEDDDEE
jgi:hypothetical protein